MASIVSHLFCQFMAAPPSLSALLWCLCAQWLWFSINENKLNTSMQTIMAVDSAWTKVWYPPMNEIALSTDNRQQAIWAFAAFLHNNVICYWSEAPEQRESQINLCLAHDVTLWIEHLPLQYWGWIMKSTSTDALCFDPWNCRSWFPFHWEWAQWYCTQWDRR